MAHASSPPSDRTTVTLSQIAELAAVRSSAVSNWRKRFRDFPRPLRTAAGARDLFALDEVEVWLTAHGRLEPGRQIERVLFQATDLIRSQVPKDRIVEILCAAIALVHVLDERQPRHGSDVAIDDLPSVPRLIQLTEQRDPTLQGDFSALQSVDPDTARQVLTLIARLPRGERSRMFDRILERERRFAETRTSQPLVNLLANLIPGGAKVVFDPAVGEGGFLLAASKALGGRIAMYGQEVNAAARLVALQRLLLNGLEASIAVGDSLADDAFPELRADVVLCDPPYGAANAAPSASPADRRWAFGITRPRSADYAWIQHVIYHLSEDGRGYVLLPAASLFKRGREAEVRSELVRQGAVEAVVALPPGSASHTAVPLALWVLKSVTGTKDARPVVFIDAVARRDTDLDEEMTSRIVQVLDDWRATGQVADEHRSFAVAIPVLDLLGRDASLVPSHWVYEEALVDPQQRHTGLLEAVNRFSKAQGDLLRTRVDTATDFVSESHRWLSVRELARQDLVDVMRGSRLRPEECQSSGVRALRTRDIRDEAIAEENPCYVDPTTLRPRPALTEPGDIIVSPGGGRPRAVVDEVGGHVLISPLQGLRLKTQDLDPQVVAHYLQSTRNERFVAGTTYGYARVDVEDLELPALGADETQWLRGILEGLTAAEHRALDMVSSVRILRERFLEAIAYGVDQSQGTD